MFYFFSHKNCISQLLWKISVVFLLLIVYSTRPFFLVYAYRMSFEPVYFSARSYFFAYCYSDKKKKK